MGRQRFLGFGIEGAGVCKGFGIVFALKGLLQSLAPGGWLAGLRDGSVFCRTCVCVHCVHMCELLRYGVKLGRPMCVVFL